MTRTARGAWPWSHPPTNDRMETQVELTKRACNTERMNAERLFARGFVVLGGVFWAAMLAASQFGYAYTPIAQGNGSMMGIAALVVIVATFVLGMFYEYLTAIGLFVGAVVVAAFGLLGGWEWPGVWLTMAVFFMAPMVVAGLMYWLAARMQKLCELQIER